MTDMDFNDMHKEQGLEAVREQIMSAKPATEKQQLVTLRIDDFLSKKYPPREYIISPIIPTQGLAMLFAKRGVGKTHIGLGIAYAAASGGKFLKWDAPQPRRVLYIDGEMPANVMQERLAGIISSDDNAEAHPENLYIMPADEQEDIFPDISCPESQKMIEAHLEGVELVILDNLSTLAQSGKENEAEGWSPIQTWALSLRRKGISVLFVHHSGKAGQQRGTSKREDVLDTVIRLQHPADYSPQEGAKFEVHLDKARGITGADAEPFEATLTDDGWTWRTLEDADMLRVIELTNEGLSLRQIQEETGIGKSKAQRLRKKAEEDGKL